jgi:hypothetical protein
MFYNYNPRARGEHVGTSTKMLEWSTIGEPLIDEEWEWTTSNLVEGTTGYLVCNSTVQGKVVLRGVF